MNPHTTWSGSTPDIAADAKVFTYGAGATWVFLLALLFALAEAILLFYRAWTTADPSTRITQIPEGVSFALIAELNWRFLRSSRARIAVNSEGIWRRQGGRTEFLAWSEVASVRANDMLQRLEITDRRDAMLRVEYQIGNFGSLRDFILAHTSEQAKLEKAGMSVFHVAWGNKLVFGTAAAILFLFAWLSQHIAGHIFIAPLLLGVLMLYGVLREPTSLDIDHDGIAIHHLGFQRDISFKSITAVNLNDVRSRGNVWAGVVINRVRGPRIRLSRFREGSVALYEALQAARRQAASAQGLAVDPSLDLGASSKTGVNQTGKMPEPASTATAPVRRTRSSGMRKIAVAVGVLVLTVVAMSVGLGETSIRKSLGEGLANRPQAAPVYPVHQGPVAPLNKLKSSGTVYLIQMGSHTEAYSLVDFAAWLHQKYAIDVQVLPAMEIDPSAWDANHRQYVAEQLYAQIKQRHPYLAKDRNAVLIGFTDADMYSVNHMWSSTFTQRDSLRTAVISTDGMGDTDWQRTHLPASAAVDRFRDRLRRILLKDVAILHWHLAVNDDASSLLHNTLDIDLPVEDIFESDLDAALSPEGARVTEPCIYFTYSDKEGMAPLPGPVIRDCGDVQDPMEDESVELFEVDLRLGLFIDKHTDIYLPDTIPIQFQRAIRDGGFGKQPFGSGGDDYYDQFLGSADSIHLFWETNDGTHVDMTQTPEWLPILGLVKFVGGEQTRAYVPGASGGAYQTVWQYEMAWHGLPYEHYELHRFNGETMAFLPCSGVPGLDCMLVDYHDSQGRQLKIERDKLRRLTKVTSPNGNWVGVATNDDRRIVAIDDNHKRTVHYGYDAGGNLSSVTYPSGEVYHYTHDGAHHILSVGVSADDKSEPRIVLRNEYQNQMVTRMTLADGSVYAIDYNSSDRMAVHHVAVHTPDGRTFDVGIGDASATVRETPAPASAGGMAGGPAR